MSRKKYLKNLVLMDKNFRGKIIPTGVGIIFVISSILVWSIQIFINIGNAIILEKLIYLTAVTGSAGFIDDAAGTEKYRGFRGHIKAFFNGIFTTGLFKAFVIFAVSTLILFTTPADNYIIINSGILILMSHLFNLLDLRPGRTIKTFFILAVIIIIFNPLSGVYVIHLFILIIFYSYFELQERVMLGDTGSYVLGIIIGFLIINYFVIYYKFVIFLILIIMTIMAEKYSFSDYIAENRFLHWLDLLGRKE